MVFRFSAPYGVVANFFPLSVTPGSGTSAGGRFVSFIALVLGGIKVSDIAARWEVRAAEENVPFITAFSRLSLDQPAATLWALRRALESRAEVLHVLVKGSMIRRRVEDIEPRANRVKLFRVEGNVVVGANIRDVVPHQHV